MTLSGSNEFDPSDPLKIIALRENGLMPPPPIVRVEGWRVYVNRPIAKMPQLPSLEAYKAYSKEQKKEFNKERKKFLSEMPLLETPQMKTIHEDALRLSVMNYSAPPGARPGIVLDGLGTVGKSSIASELGKSTNFRGGRIYYRKSTMQ